MAKLVFNALPSNSQGGGAIIKMLKIRDYMVAKGNQVDLFDQWTTQIGEYDIYHHFSMFAADLPIIRTARTAGAKICVETMYWGSWSHVLKAPGGESALRRALRIGRYAQRRLIPKTTQERAILDLADCVMVNSAFERDNLHRDFNVPKEKIAVCYNGVDASFADADPTLFIERFGVQDFVLVTGIFEERKNHLGIIEAMRGLDIPLVLIGATPPEHRWYREQCEAAAGPNVHFIEAMDHDDPLFRSAYAACKVLAMPSWHETTGKSALEAGLLAKRVLMTTYAPAAQEYLGDLVAYIDPGDIASMRHAVEEAVAAPPAHELQKMVAEKYTWETVLAEREKAYQSLL